MPTLLLIHGGLWEDIDADWFWRRTGIVTGLEGLGFTVVAPDRLRRPTSWAADAEHVAGTARRREDSSEEPVTVVGESFGCTAAVRIALDSPGLVGRMVLAWPASLGDQFTAIGNVPDHGDRLRRILSPFGVPRPACRRRA
jgi:pimeloyl-ACP methyl ester carboxylesterase